MKTTRLFRSAATIAAMAVALIAATAQNRELSTVSGTVSDKESKERIEAAFVSIQGTDIATSTNSDGKFTLKYPSEMGLPILNISHIGYEVANIRAERNKPLKIGLAPAPKVIRQMTFVKGDAMPVVSEALRHVPQNYAKSDNMLSGFYRETVRKRNTYINVAEAVVDIYKTPYDRYNSRDGVSILKGRKLMSQNSSDTLAVKLAGGPTAAIGLDFLKSPDHFLSESEIENYWFYMVEPTIIDGRDHYGVYFEPRSTTGVYYGTLYIDCENYTISRLRVFMDVSKREQVTRIMLIKRPAGLYFRPEESSVTVAYKQSPSGAYMSYIGSTLRFRCDWKRRLFSTGYTVVSEMVTTDRSSEGVKPLQRDEKFGKRELLVDNVADFYDENFWTDYNIIEPSESLEHAVGRLKKQHD